MQKFQVKKGYIDKHIQLLCVTFLNVIDIEIQIFLFQPSHYSL